MERRNTRLQRDAKKTSNPQIEKAAPFFEQLLSDIRARQNAHNENASSDEALVYGKFREKYIVNNWDEYQRDAAKEPGFLIIFNYTFMDSADNKRLGTKYDVENLISTFGRLGFNVDKKNVHNDLDRHDVLQTLADALKSDECSNCNSFVLVFLTHGSIDDELQVAGASCVYMHELWEAVDKCEKMKNIPKLFLIQACKGQDTTVVDSANEKCNIVSKSVLSREIPPNIITVFATMEGAVSYRDPQNGSWFIQEFCRNVMSHGKYEDVDSLITRTRKCVASVYYYLEEITNREDSRASDDDERAEFTITKQMPTSVSTLCKKFYLTNNKHRHYVNEESKKFQEIMGIMKELVE